MSAPGWSAVAIDPEEQRLLLARRVAFFGRVIFLLSVTFYVRNVVQAAKAVHGFPPLLHPALAVHLAAVLVGLGQWVACRGGRLSRALVEWVDAGGLVTTMALYGVLTVLEARGLDAATGVAGATAESLLMSLITVSVVLTRAIIVPSTARRTFVLSTVACAAGPIASYAIVLVGVPEAELAKNPWLPIQLASYALMWAVLTVVVATIAARVIHGLSQRVREADEIGQYRLERKIGEGGMGVVYLARHALLRRPTAVKLLLAERAGESAVRRFEQEVQLTSALTHPNTISIFDFGRTPDGIFYYAMEYLDGLTLEDLVTHDGPQPEARVARILAQVCGALAEAHERGLIHRDIKPANLMLCERGGIPDQVKVLDFGLVKDHAGGELGLSRAGGLLGTPQYLAPESILDPSGADSRLDLYAVGAVGYYLLAGTPVFEGKTIVEVCAQHLHGTPVPIGDKLGSTVDADLEALILRALAKAPAERPRSARDMARAFTHLASRPGFDDDDASRWWKARAPELLRDVESRRRISSTPGPLTVAIDLESRAPRAQPARELGGAFSSP